MRLWCFFIFFSYISIAEATDIQGTTMGSPYQIKWHNGPAQLSANELSRKIDARLQQLNLIFSHYQPRSELSNFNDSRTGGPVSAELLQVIKRASVLHQETSGALDITVSPLVSLWGFGPNGTINTPPSTDAIALAKAKTGMNKLVLGDGRLDKQHPDLTITLGAIAKGYAVDQLAELLEENAVNDFLINIGGEIRLKGKSPQGEPWRVGIELPGSYGVVDQIIS